MRLSERPLLEGPSVLEVALREELQNYPQRLFAKGEIVVRQHSFVKAIPLVLEGQLRVYRQTEDREIVYYYVQKGDTCGLCLGACLEDKKIESEIAAAKASFVIFIPSHKVQEWQRTYQSWNNYLLHTFTTRQQQLITSLDDMAFSKMEKRLGDYLSHLVQQAGNPVVWLTHQELANELGTTRVVISRILKSMETKGSVDLLRGAIHVKKLAWINSQN